MAHAIGIDAAEANNRARFGASGGAGAKLYSRVPPVRMTLDQEGYSAEIAVEPFRCWFSVAKWRAFRSAEPCEEDAITDIDGETPASSRSACPPRPHRTRRAGDYPTVARTRASVRRGQEARRYARPAPPGDGSKTMTKTDFLDAGPMGRVAAVVA